MFIFFIYLFQELLALCLSSASYGYGFAAQLTARYTHQVYLRTENILAIFPMARILFLITSFRAAAALAGIKKEKIQMRQLDRQY